ncbi:MAG: PilZ domain-containing protein [Candidatus Omnitrophota bacterium]|nr:PilZ domain-containing protein [Candidatus Omnitrophota bacterium]
MSDGCRQERRKLVRFLVAIPLKYVSSNLKSINATCTQNISGQGLGLISDEELPINTPLIICLKVPDNGEEITLEAEVVWSKQVDDFKYRYGLKLKSRPIKPIPLVLRTIYSKL